MKTRQIRTLNYCGRVRRVAEKVQQNRGSMSQRRRPAESHSSQTSHSRGTMPNEVVMEEDEDVSFTQPSSSQVQRGLDRLTPAQVDQKVAEVVQFILIKDQKKVPIKRADIVKNVIKEYKNIYPEIIKRANMKFEKVFGFQLVEVDPKNHAYILVNKLEQDPRQPAVMSPGHPKTGLLFVILSVIFMKGGVVKEPVVWNTLKKLRVDQGEKHEEFGDVKKLVTEEFVRQRYLEYTRIPHTEPLEHEFRWGVRAEKEVDKMKMLELVSQVHDQEPQTWTKQYKEAMAARGINSQS